MSRLFETDDAAAGGAGGAARTPVPAVGGAARGAHAPSERRRARRPGASAGRRVDAAHGDRDRRAALDGPLRAAGDRQDHAREDRRLRRPRGLRGGVGGERWPRRGTGDDRARHRAPAGHRPANDLLPRRDPPLQQGPAGRAAAGGGGGARDPDRGDHREPVLRGQLGPPQPRPDLRAAAAHDGARARTARPGARRPRARDRRSAAGRRRGPRPPRAAVWGRRAHRLRGARARGRGGSGRVVGARPRARRGRAAAQGGELRQAGRHALRLRLGPDQVDAGLRPRRRRCTTWPRCSRAARTRGSSSAGW